MLFSAIHEAEVVLHTAAAQASLQLLAEAVGKLKWQINAFYDLFWHTKQIYFYRIVLETTHKLIMSI